MMNGSLYMMIKENKYIYIYRTLKKKIKNHKKFDTNITLYIQLYQNYSTLYFTHQNYKNKKYKMIFKT